MEHEIIRKLRERMRAAGYDALIALSPSVLSFRGLPQTLPPKNLLFPKIRVICQVIDQNRIPAAVQRTQGRVGACPERTRVSIRPFCHFEREALGPDEKSRLFDCLPP